MIAAKQNFTSRQPLNERQIFLALCQLSPPGMIAGENKRILRLYDFIYILLYLSLMVLPDSSKLVHRFICLKAQMQIAQSIKRHKSHLLSVWYLFSFAFISIWYKTVKNDDLKNFLCPFQFILISDGPGNIFHIKKFSAKRIPRASAPNMVVDRKRT